MSLGKNRKRINVRGGGTLLLRELSPSPTDTFSDAGYIASSKLTDERDVITTTDERGELVEASTGSRSVRWETVLQQSGADEINLLRNADGKYYEAFYSVKTAGNTLVQEISLPLCRIKPGPVLEFASGAARTMQLTLYALSPKAAYVRTPSAFDVSAGEAYIIVEGTVANGVPVDPAAAVAAAIL